MGVVENVVLANSGRPISIQADHVYFAFPSGRLTYDCVSCGAKCCRGFGYEVFVDRDLQRQLGTRHALRFFLDPCEAGAADHYHARNLKPACFFLDEQNACSLHVQHGYDTKPETCRLFPFNQFNRVGDYLIVAPHPELCPLAILPPGERSDASSQRRAACCSASSMDDGIMPCGLDLGVFVEFQPMSPEDVQRTMQFLLRQQAQFAADFARVDAQLEALSGKVDQFASGLIGLTSIVGRVVDSVSEIAEAQKRTDKQLRTVDAHLDIVIEMFERHLREDHGHRPS
jgi:Fe-S-cluster containining protein